MLNRTAFRLITLIIALAMMPVAGIATDISADVEKILREIRQDQPVPAVDYLQPAEPINADCASYRGSFRGIGITVETHPASDRVASLLLQVPGADRTRQIFPAVKRVIGPPRYASPKKSEYGWEWPNYRTASLHYVGGAKPGEGSTIVSLFYR
jgi:hypothetical protein